MNPEKILTKHPQNKKGVYIDLKKYQLIKTQILACLQKDECTYTEMVKYATSHLESFSGSVGWYLESVKLDLEAKSIIERIPHTKPERYRLR